MVFRASLEILSSFSASSSAAFNAVSVALKMMPLLDPRCTLIDWNNNLLDRRIGTQENHPEMLSHAALGIGRPLLLGV